MKINFKRGMAHILTLAIIVSMFIVPATVSADEAWRNYVTIVQEDNFEGTALNNGGIAWRSIRSTGTAPTISTNVADPTSGNEKMLKFEYTYNDTDKATQRSSFIDNNSQQASDTITGVSVHEMSLYFSSTESLLNSDSYLMWQATFNGGAQQAIVLRDDGFYGSATGTTPAYAMDLPRYQWFKLMLVCDYDNGKWYVKVVTADGTVTTVRTVTQASKAAVTLTRLTYSDKLTTEGKSSWFGMGYYRHYKLKSVKEYNYTGSTATGGKAAVGKTIGVEPTFSTAAPALTYQWCKAPTELGNSTDLSTATDIVGATSSTYTPTEDDIGSFLFVKIFADESQLYPGWPNGGKSLIAVYPEKGMADWAIDPNPFVIDFGAEVEGTVYRHSTKGAFVNSAKTLYTNVAGDFTAATVKSAGNKVKDGALEIKSTTPASGKHFFMHEQNAFGGMKTDVLQIEQKYYIPSGSFTTFNTTSDSDWIRHDNRFGGTGTTAPAVWNVYWIRGGYIYNSDNKEIYAPIPYDEWFTLREVYFTKDVETTGKVYEDIVLVREDGTEQPLICGAVVTNATFINALKDSGYRRSRTQVGFSATTPTHFYLGDFSVKCTKDYAATPGITYDIAAGEVSAVAVCADHASAEDVKYALYIAQYRGGNLVTAKMATGDGGAANACKLTNVMSGLDLQKGDVLKAFLWLNDGSLNPLAACANKVVTE